MSHLNGPSNVPSKYSCSSHLNPYIHVYPRGLIQILLFNDAEGHVIVGGPGTQQGCELHLRSMSLVNLQPAHPAAMTSDTTSAASLLGNFNSLLWFFGIDRMSKLRGPQDRPSNDISSSLGSIVLFDVAIMVSPFELQILRALMKNSTSRDLENLLSSEALRLLKQQINAGKYTIGPKGNVLLLGGDVGLSSLSQYIWSNASSSAVPGDILFTTFDWFGITGRNVIITASEVTISSNATFRSFFPQMDPVGSGSSTTANATGPVLGAPQPILMTNLSAPLLVTSPVPLPSLGRWQIALVITIPITAAVLSVAAVAFWLHVHRRRQKRDLEVCK